MIPRDVSSTPGIDRPRCKWVISLINDFSFLSSHKYPSSYKRGCCSGFGWWGAYRQEFACSTKFSSLCKGLFLLELFSYFFFGNIRLSWKVPEGFTMFPSRQVIFFSLRYQVLFVVAHVKCVFCSSAGKAVDYLH